MTRDELNNAYLDWMYRLVFGDRYSKRLSYRKLLSHLHSIPFTYTIALDGNRADDGIDLRYRFGYERSYEDSRIASYLDDRPCSVLEMLVALAFRCEEHIMDDPDIGNRTGQWFWNMIGNLGLSSMSDRTFNRNRVDDAVSTFLERRYKPNGEGGLFVVDGNHDMRSSEIWCQMCWYLNNLI